MEDDALTIAPPRRALLFVFVITGFVLLLNGLAVLFFAPIPRSEEALQPGPFSLGTGAGGWMPVVAGLLCLAGAAWMLNRHRKVVRIAELVHADLPEDAVEAAGRERLVNALLERSSQLTGALVDFPEAVVTIELRVGDDHRLSIEAVRTGGFSVRLSPGDDALARKIEKHAECVVLDREVLLDFPESRAAADFIDTLTSDVLALPPDFEMAGDIRVSRRFVVT